jgi:hypothetical protein
VSRERVARCDELGHRCEQMAIRADVRAQLGIVGLHAVDEVAIETANSGEQLACDHGTQLGRRRDDERDHRVLRRHASCQLLGIAHARRIIWQEMGKVCLERETEPYEQRRCDDGADRSDDDRASVASEPGDVPSGARRHESAIVATLMPRFDHCQLPWLRAPAGEGSTRMMLGWTTGRQHHRR